MRVLPRFVYRAPLLPVGGKLEGALAEQAIAIARVAPEARAKYERRAAFRATPHGLWAGVGMGTLGDETRAATGAMRAEITVAYERLWRIARERMDPATAKLRVAPSLVRDETTALWIAFGDESEAQSRSAEVDDVLAAVLDGAEQWVEWGALREAAGVDDEFLRAARRRWPARARRRAAADWPAAARVDARAVTAIWRTRSPSTRCWCTKAR